MSTEYKLQSWANCTTFSLASVQLSFWIEILQAMKIYRFCRDGAGGLCHMSHGVDSGLRIGSSVLSSLLLVAVIASLCRAQEKDTVEATSSSRAPTEDYPARNKEDVTILSVVFRHPFISTLGHKSDILTYFTDALKNDKPGFDFFEYFNLKVEEFVFEIGDGPLVFLRFLCKTYLPRNVSAIFMVNDNEYNDLGNVAHYLIRLTDKLSIPVFTMKIATTGSDDISSKNLIQLATPIAHQASAVLSVLRRYAWCKFSIVTTNGAGHLAFVREVKKQMVQSRSEVRLTLLTSITINLGGDDTAVSNELSQLRRTNTRVIVLYSTRSEVDRVFVIAKEMRLGSRSHEWIFIDFLHGISLHNDLEVRDAFDFIPNRWRTSWRNDLSNTILVFLNMLELFIEDPNGKNVGLHSPWSCNTTQDEARGKEEGLIRYLRNVNGKSEGAKETVEFNPDGTQRNSKISFFSMDATKDWTNLGSWTNDGLTILDWTGEPLVILPDKLHLRVAFREERPFVIRRSTNPVSGVCANNEAPCHGIQESDDRNPINVSLPEHVRRLACCSGFCVDLLKKLATDMQFDFTLLPVEDVHLGTKEKDAGWNALVAVLLQNKTDIVVSSFSINSMREKAIDFSVPFLDTGIAIAVAKRAGIVSPNAFLEPFETTSWIMILVVSVHLATFVIFLLEWLSPSVYNMTLEAPRGYGFSLLRAYWTVWADLFNAAVEMYCPRSVSARLMTSAWALFAIVLAAVYTANLATFMVIKEEYYHISGIKDDRFADPTFRFGTTLAGNTESILRENYPDIYNRTIRFNKNSVEEGLAALKMGELDAFLYDATVLKYLVNQDKDCKLNTVGKLFAETGYSIGFRQNFEYVSSFNSKIMAYREDGTLESLRNFWLPGRSTACDPNKLEQSSSKPVTLHQFTTAFYVLGLGIVFAVFVLLVEHLYFRYRSQDLSKVDSRGFCAMITRGMDVRETNCCQVCEDYDLLKRHHCCDPTCKTQILIKKTRN